MQNQQTETHFIFVSLLAILVLTFFIFQPYLYAIIVGMAIATVFFPLFKKIKKGIHYEGLAATVTTMLIALVIVLPLSLIIFQIVSEASDVYQELATSNTLNSTLHQSLDTMQAQINRLVPNANINLDTYLEETLQAVIGRFSGIFAGTLFIALNVFLAIMACFYSLTSANTLKERAASILPLRTAYLKNIIHQLELAIDSIIRGTLVVALIQGVLIGAGFYFFGVPKAILWGSAGVFAALIPALGTSLVSIPGIVYLFVTDQTLPAIGLLVWSAVIVSSIDNVIKPYLMSRGLNIHPFLVLISVFGGLAFFGPLGLFLGPLTLSLLFALLTTYTAIQNEKLD